MTPEKSKENDSDINETKSLELDDSENVMKTRLVENLIPLDKNLVPFPKPKTENIFLDRFVVIKMLGEGAFGKVYLAKDERLDRLVAVKISKQPISDQKQLHLFLSEARMLAKLDHPNIVPVYDVVNSETEGVFIISKFIEGGSLSEIILTAAYNSTKVVKWIANLADALHHAHIRGLVHRDIKPDNILVDQQSNLFITDYGLALSEDLFGKGTGILGTPAYMSPEQASGQASLVDGRSDLFSLGIIFYEMLTGRRPFEAKTVSLTLQQIIRVEAKPLRQIKDNIAKELERICLKALSKNLNERYLTGLDFAEDLNNYIKSLELVSKPSSGSVYESSTVSGSKDSALGISAGQMKSENLKVAQIPGMDSVNKVLDSRGLNLQAALESSDKDFSHTRPILQQQLYDLKGDPIAKTNVMLALLPSDPSYAITLLSPFVSAKPQDFLVMKNRLQPYAETLVPQLEKKAAEVSSQNPLIQLRIAGALAHWQPQSAVLDKLMQGIVMSLAGQDLIYLQEWVEIFRPVQKLLLHKLVSFAQDSNNPPIHRNFANGMALEYALDNERILFHLFAIADPSTARKIFVKILPLKEKMKGYLQRFRSASIVATNHLDKTNGEIRKGMAAALQIALDDPEGFSVFLNSQDATARTHTRLLLGNLGVNPALVFEKIRIEPDVGTAASLVLALGNLNLDLVSENIKKQWSDFFLEQYKNHPDAGLHSALEWFLKQRLGLSQVCDQVIRTLENPQDPSKNWFVNPLGLTFIRIPGPVKFIMGSPLDEPNRITNEQLHEVTIPRSFVIAQKMVTIKHYLNFNPGFQPDRKNIKTNDCPVNDISWYKAAEYCNWLSAQENIPRQEWCYLPNEKGVFAAGMRLANDFLNRKGYRLPTEAEWEYCARAGTKTAWYFGSDVTQLEFFAHYQKNSNNQISPVAQLLPNNFGLFDMAGNLYQWTQDILHPYPDSLSSADAKADAKADLRPLDDMTFRVLRGGAFYYPGEVLRSAHRGGLKPDHCSDGSGFRPVRTL